MPKKILIPIDFNVESLNTLKGALVGLGDTETEVVLMYSEFQSDSITELLFYSSEAKLKEKLTPVFQEALTILKNRYENILLSISIEFFYGFNSAAFKNFIDGHHIDLIYIPETYTLKPMKNGFDPVPIIRKSNLPYQEIRWEEILDTSPQYQLSYLFI